MNAPKHNLLQALENHPEIATIHIEYDGYSDSGAITEITCLNKDGNSIPTTEHLTSAIIDYVYTILPTSWETGEGAFGRIEFDATTGKSRILHHERIVETITQEFEV